MDIFLFLVSVVVGSAGVPIEVSVECIVTRRTGAAELLPAVVHDGGTNANELSLAANRSFST